MDVNGHHSFCVVWTCIGCTFVGWCMLSWTRFFSIPWLSRSATTGLEVGNLRWQSLAFVCTVYEITGLGVKNLLSFCSSFRQSSQIYSICGATSTFKMRVSFPAKTERGMTVYVRHIFATHPTSFRVFEAELGLTMVDAWCPSILLDVCFIR